VRLLVDECLSARLCELLEPAGYDVVHARDLGLLGAPDADVMAAAAEQDRVLLSADTDFGELLANSGAAKPSLVLLRRVAKSPEAQAPVLIANLPAVADDLAAGAVVVILSDRLRIRRLPVDGAS
jgi:predicted nuclease of predicted toxin-antitoxin system